ncbi:MAG TPA: YciI family protein [Actinomycetota bacterium]|nr:YciI family protein [Actinomycetota bacterium]
MPKYVALIYGDETQYANMTPEEGAKVFQAYGEYTEAVRGAGISEVGEGLQGTNTATTVQVRNGELTTTDGPFAETKEQLGGFYVFNCKDLDEAIEWAAKIPGASDGSVEIRPVIEM